MERKKMRRKCFAVLLTMALVIQEPSLSRADYFGREMFLNRQAVMYSFRMEPVQRAELEYAEGFRIRYYLNGGVLEGENPADYQKEEMSAALEIPMREGYNFAGWYRDSRFEEKATDFEADVPGEYALYAKWTKRIDAQYNIDMYAYPNAAAGKRAGKKLKDVTYSLLEHVKIPGMPSTREEDVRESRIPVAGQCPQGICFTDAFLLISAYSEDGDFGCLHVFDRATGAYLVSLGMKKGSHMGGLAFDGESVWVCHSGSSTLERIPYAFVQKEAQNAPQSVVDCTGRFKEYHVANAPSCIDHYDGMLWVATHTKFFNSKMAAYKVTEHGLRQMKTYRIPDKVQGIAFDEDGRVYVSASYGRKKSSFLKAYASVEQMDQKPGDPLVKIEMPPCSEEIAWTKDQIYVLFESAGEKYLEGTDGRGKSLSPLDEVLVLPRESVLE